MNFEEYLISKKIDSAAFRAMEPALWESWKEEFGQLHPNSFTAQKLYLINPLRRQYPLKETPPVEKSIPASATGEEQKEISGTPSTSADNKPAKPAVPKPVFKPKPKMN